MNSSFLFVGMVLMSESIPIFQYRSMTEHKNPEHSHTQPVDPGNSSTSSVGQLS